MVYRIIAASLGSRAIGFLDFTLGSSTPDVASPSDLRGASVRLPPSSLGSFPLASAVASPARRCG